MATGITSDTNGIYFPWPNFIKILFAVLLIIVVGVIIVVTASQSDDKVKTISKDGAVDTRIEVTHLNNDFDLLKTTHAVWVKNQLVKGIENTDTIPTLGQTVQHGENSDGKDTVLILPKDYEIYITVK